ncbi:MAG: hypothetical protein ABIG11_03485 [bacterium]
MASEKNGKKNTGRKKVKSTYRKPALTKHGFLGEQVVSLKAHY